MSSIHRRLAELEEAGAQVAVVTVVRTQGSTPREAGAKMIVHPDGSTEGTVGGGTVELRAIEAAKEALARGEPRFVEMHLTQELGMCCGGAVGLFVEILHAAPALLIFGAGHVGSALARVALEAGFRVHLADERQDIRAKIEVPSRAVFHDDLDDPELPGGPETFVMITTHDHGLDQRLVERMVKLPFRWLGVIGSRRKAELTRKRLSHRGVPEELIRRVRIPVGLAIGAETPQEIAVSILAELIAVRRGAALVEEAPSGAAVLETKAG